MWFLKLWTCSLIIGGEHHCGLTHFSSVLYLTQKPVICFALQNKWLVSISNVTLRLKWLKIFVLSEIFSGGVFKTHAKHQRLSFLPLFLQESSITVAWQCFNVTLFKKLFSEPLLTVHSVLAFSGKYECKLFSGKAWPICSSRVYSCYKILRSKYFFQNYSKCHILSILKNTSKSRPGVYEMGPGNEFYHEWPRT